MNKKKIENSLVFWSDYFFRLHHIICIKFKKNFINFFSLILILEINSYKNSVIKIFYIIFLKGDVHDLIGISHKMPPFYSRK